MNLKSLLAFVVLVFAQICIADQSDDKSADQRALSIELTKAVNEINAQVPVELDEHTRVDSAATFRNYIIYNNTMTQYSSEDLEAEILDKIIKESVIDKLCTNSTFASFIELGVVMVYRYVGKDGQFISELSKDMGSCP